MTSPIVVMARGSRNGFAGDAQGGGRSDAIGARISKEPDCFSDPYHIRARYVSEHVKTRISDTSGRATKGDGATVTGTELTFDDDTDLATPLKRRILLRFGRLTSAFCFRSAFSCSLSRTR